MSFAIFTDTSANLPTLDARKHGIGVIPLSFLADGKESTSLDTDQFDYESYYNGLKNGVRVTTSQINPQKYVDQMEQTLENGQDILFIGMSAGISGSFHSAEIARDILLEDHPDRKICLVDSMGASLGEGLLVYRAIELREAGKTLEETAEILLERRMHIAQIFTVDDLMFLKRGGRLSNASAIVGTLLGVKPLLKGNEEGKIVSFAKTRGRKAVIDQLAKRYEKLVVDPEHQIVGISHGNCPEDACRLAELINQLKTPREIKIVNHEPVTGSYLGMGALALYFEGGDKIRWEK